MTITPEEDADRTQHIRTVTKLFTSYIDAVADGDIDTATRVSLDLKVRLSAYICRKMPLPLGNKKKLTG
jgi:predicted phosphoribosyltransferase